MSEIAMCFDATDFHHFSEVRHIAISDMYVFQSHEYLEEIVLK